MPYTIRVFSPAHGCAVTPTSLVYANRGHVAATGARGIRDEFAHGASEVCPHDSTSDESAPLPDAYRAIDEAKEI